VNAEGTIQIGGLTAKAQRREGVARIKAPAATNHQPVRSAAGANTQKPPLRLCAFAVKPASLTELGSEGEGLEMTE
jgi:hypothetical protein